MKQLRHWIAAVGIAALVSAFAVMTPAAGAATTTAPGAPTGLTATAGFQQVMLSWTAPTTGGAVEGYNILEGTSGPGSESALPVNNVTLVSGTTATVTGLTDGQEYWFEVVAVNQAGTSPASNEVSATPAESAPSAPTAPTATQGWTSATVCWTVPASNSGFGGITGFTITPSSGTPILITTTSANNAGISFIPGASDCYLVTGLTNGTAYSFTVSATNDTGTGTASPASNSVTPGLSPPAAPGADGNAYGTAISDATDVNADTIDIIIPMPPVSNLIATGGSPILGYNIYEGTTQGGESSTPINGATLECYNQEALNTGTGTVDCVVPVGPLTAGQAYWFTVKAVNAQGSSASSNEVEAVPGVGYASSAPTAVTAVGGDTTATVSFTAPTYTGGTGATIVSYTATCTSSDGGATGTASGTSSPITVTGLTAGDDYTCTVTATNSYGITSAASAASNEFTTGPTAPTTPANLQLARTITGGGDTLTLSWYLASWNGNTSDDGFQIYENGTLVGFVSTTATPYNCGPYSNPPTDTTPSEYCTFNATGQTGTTGALGTDNEEYSWTSAVLSASSSYSFDVVAVNALGNSPASAAVSATPSDATPAAPTDLAATTAGLMANTAPTPSGDITLTWNQSPYVADGVTAYDIYVSTVSGNEVYTAAPDTQFAGAPGDVNCGVNNLNNPQAGGGGTGDTTGPCTATLTGPGTGTFTPGQTYYFTVVAVGTTPTNVSAPSNEASVALLAPPGAPFIVRTIPENTAIQIEWNGPSNDGGSPVTGYNLFIAPEVSPGTCPQSWYFPSNAGTGFQVATNVPGSTYTFTGLTNGTTYCIGVEAVNAIGAGPLSIAFQTANPTPPGSPTGLTATAGADGTATLSWTAPVQTAGSTIIGYEIWYSNTGTGTPGATDPLSTEASGNYLVPGTTAVVTGLVAGETYSFAVYAVNADLQVGTPSNVATAVGTTALSAPGAPTAVTATAKAGQATIVWTAPTADGGASITGYIVEAFHNGSLQGSVRVGKVSGVTIKGLTPGSQYFFKVAAVNAIGTGVWSGPSNAVNVPKFTATITFGVSSHNTTFGKEHAVHLSVHVTGADGTVGGKVSIMGAKACHITLKGGKGGCWLSNRQLSVGSHNLVAYYQGSSVYTTAKSGVDILVVHKAHKKK